jgi:hypothetical protein
VLDNQRKSELLIDGGVASIFQNHGWYWGLAFCDAMHFQYATNY